MGCVGSTASGASSKAASSADRDVLQAVYIKSGGESWTEAGRRGWNAEKDIARWGGVVLHSKGAKGSTTAPSTPAGSSPAVPAGDKEGRVKELSLERCALSGTIPEDVGFLRFLEVLRLGSNALSGPIPDSLGRLWHLKTLLLDNNQLTGSLPEALACCSQLEVLNVSSNCLSGPVPVFLALLSSLRELNISKNEFSGGIPKGVVQLSSLRLLDVSNNKLSGTVPKELMLSTTLVVCMQGNALTAESLAAAGTAAKQQQQPAAASAPQAAPAAKAVVASAPAAAAVAGATAASAAPAAAPAAPATSGMTIAAVLAKARRVSGGGSNTAAAAAPAAAVAKAAAPAPAAAPLFKPSASVNSLVSSSNATSATSEATLSDQEKPLMRVSSRVRKMEVPGLDMKDIREGVNAQVEAEMQRMQDMAEKQAAAAAVPMPPPPALAAAGATPTASDWRALAAQEAARQEFAPDTTQSVETLESEFGDGESVYAPSPLPAASSALASKLPASGGKDDANSGSSRDLREASGAGKLQRMDAMTPDTASPSPMQPPQPSQQLERTSSGKGSPPPYSEVPVAPPAAPMVAATPPPPVHIPTAPRGGALPAPSAADTTTPAAAAIQPGTAAAAAAAAGVMTSAAPSYHQQHAAAHESGAAGPQTSSQPLRDEAPPKSTRSDASHRSWRRDTWSPAAQSVASHRGYVTGYMPQPQHPVPWTYHADGQVDLGGGAGAYQPMPVLGVGQPAKAGTPLPQPDPNDWRTINYMSQWATSGTGRGARTPHSVYGGDLMSARSHRSIIGDWRSGGGAGYGGYAYNAYTPASHQPYTPANAFTPANMRTPGSRGYRMYSSGQWDAETPMAARGGGGGGGGMGHYAAETPGSVAPRHPNYYAETPGSMRFNAETPGSVAGGPRYYAETPGSSVAAPSGRRRRATYGESTRSSSSYQFEDSYGAVNDEGANQRALEDFMRRMRAQNERR